MTFDHRVTETTRDTQVLGQYGIEFASMAGLPDEILNTARGVLETIATEVSVKDLILSIFINFFEP